MPAFQIWTELFHVAWPVDAKKAVRRTDLTLPLKSECLHSCLSIFKFIFTYRNIIKIAQNSIKFQIFKTSLYRNSAAIGVSGEHLSVKKKQ